MKGFVVLPHGWIVERTVSWFGRKPASRPMISNFVKNLATFVALVSIPVCLSDAGHRVGRELTLGLHDDGGRQIGW